jgi:hypothetical protein
MNPLNSEYQNAIICVDGNLDLNNLPVLQELSKVTFIAAPKIKHHVIGFHKSWLALCKSQDTDLAMQM